MRKLTTRLYIDVIILIHTTLSGLVYGQASELAFILVEFSGLARSILAGQGHINAHVIDTLVEELSWVNDREARLHSAR